MKAKVRFSQRDRVQRTAAVAFGPERGDSHRIEQQHRRRRPVLRRRVQATRRLCRTWKQPVWLVARTGGIFGFSDAGFYGSMGRANLGSKSVIRMAATASGHGYWLVATRPLTPAAPQLVPLTIAAQSHQSTYDRAADFGGWIIQSGCKDTRAVVLIRTSLAPVTYTTSSQCTSRRASGSIRGRESRRRSRTTSRSTTPSRSRTRGVRAPGPGRRVNAFPIRTISPTRTTSYRSLSENRSKGDSGPETWKPPSSATWCSNSLVWDRIKAKWHLTATAAEWTALVEMAATC